MTTQLDRVVLIGVAGDSGCGKSTFLRRLADLFGEEFMTVICLDDYHSLDRKQRKEQGVTALNPKANNFDLMYEQIKALKNGQAINKPIYNHETGELDPPERVKPNKIVVIEGLHPLYDERVRSLLDFSVYLDISDEVKIAWKIQRDMAERGHRYEDVMAAINSRRPDFSAYIRSVKYYGYGCSNGKMWKAWNPFICSIKGQPFIGLLVDASLLVLTLVCKCSTDQITTTATMSLCWKSMVSSIG